MRTDLFDFELPDELIALLPASPRDAARLLLVDASTGRFGERTVRDLPDLLRPGDALVLNDTRVIPAALEGVRRRGGVGAKVAFNLIKRVDDSRWRALARPAKRLAVGDRIRFGGQGNACLLGDLDATVAAKAEAGEVELAFELSGAYLDEAIARSAACRCRPTLPEAPGRSRGRGQLPDHLRPPRRRRGGADRRPPLHARAASGAWMARHLPATSSRCTSAPAPSCRSRPMIPPITRMHSRVGRDHAPRRPLPSTRSGPAAAASSPSAPRRCACWRALPATTAQFARSPATPQIFITPGYRFKAVDVLHDQFPPAALDAVHAGRRLRRARDHARGLCARHRRAAIASIPTATPACSSRRRP